MKHRRVLTYFSFLFAFLPFLSTWVSSIPGYVLFENWIFLGFLILTVVMGVYVHARKEKDAVFNRVFFGVVIFMLLLLVQNTGWFYSPLLYLLYLAAMATILMYSFSAV